LLFRLIKNWQQDVSKKEIDHNYAFYFNSVIFLQFYSPVSYWMYQAEKKYDISIKKVNEEITKQMASDVSCPLKLSEQDTSDYAQIVSQSM